MKILSINAGWIADSELDKTLEVRIETDQGVFSGSAPQGTSVGWAEAVTRDVNTAVRNIEDIVPRIIEMDPSDLRRLDEYLHGNGCYNMRNLGANGSVALSSAWAKMAAAANNVPLHYYLAGLLGESQMPRMPVPAFNIINGGMHGIIYKNGKPYNPIQEIMLVPIAASFEEAYTMAMRVFQKLKKISGETLVGKEGGISPALPITECLNMVVGAIEGSHYEASDFKLAIDAAATHFYDDKSQTYNIASGKDEPRTLPEMVAFYKELVAKSPIQIMSIEDPLREHDFKGFAELNRALEGVLVIGDDLYVTQLKRVKEGIEAGSASGIIIKLNQNGTVTGTLDVIRYGLEHGLVHMVSHRSKRAPCELIDAYLAVAVGQMIKYGSSRGERVEVYNELLRIERDAKTSGNPLEYAGNEMFNNRSNRKVVALQGNGKSNQINDVDLEQMLAQLQTDAGRGFLLYELLKQELVPEAPYLQMAVDYFVMAERFSDARRIAGLTRVDRIKSHPLKDYIAEAEAAEVQGDFKRAAELYESAARNSSSADSYERAGDAAAKAGLLSFARSMYCKANREYSRQSSRSAGLDGEEVPVDFESEDEQRMNEKLIALRDRQIRAGNQGIIPDFIEELMVIEKDGDFEGCARLATGFTAEAGLNDKAKLYERIVHILGYDK